VVVPEVVDDCVDVVVEPLPADPVPPVEAVVVPCVEPEVCVEADPAPPIVPVAVPVALAIATGATGVEAPPPTCATRASLAPLASVTTATKLWPGLKTPVSLT